LKSELKLNEILKTIGKNSLIYGISTALQPLGGFILLPLYSENFEKSEFGIYTLILLISTIFSTVFYLGINSAFIRSYYDYDLEEDRIKVFNTSLLILIIGLLLQILTCFITANYLSVSILKNESYVGLLLISVITSGISFVNTGFLNYLRVKEKAFIYTLISSFSFVISVTLTLCLFEYFNKGIDSPIYSALVSQLIIMLLLILIHIKDINLFNINRSEIKVLLHFGLPSIFASISIMIGEWGDKLLINEFLDRDELGVFSMGFRIAMIYNVIVAMPFALVWSPLMMKLKDHKDIQSIFARVSFLYFGISLIFIFLIYILLDPLLSIIGFHAKFNDSISFVPVLMTAIAFGSLQNIYSAGIIYARKPIILVYVYSFVGFLNFIMSYFAVIHFGLHGIMASFLFFKLLNSLAIFYFSSKYLIFRIFDFNYVFLILAFTIVINLYLSFVKDFESLLSSSLYFVISFLFLLFLTFRKEGSLYSAIENFTIHDIHIRNFIVLSRQCCLPS
jgi:O-antigen/teichoic acid export membrane protein